MVDTLVSGTSASNGVQVRLLSWAQKEEVIVSPLFLYPSTPCRPAAFLLSLVS